MSEPEKKDGEFTWPMAFTLVSIMAIIATVFVVLIKS